MSRSVMTFPARNFKFLSEGSLAGTRNYRFCEKEIIACCEAFGVWRLAFRVSRSPFTVRRSAFTVRRSPFGGAGRYRWCGFRTWVTP
jgi:hypothetical protein